MYAHASDKEVWSVRIHCLCHTGSMPNSPTLLGQFYTIRDTYTTMDLPPLMQTTPGITEGRFTQDPLGTEGELTPGPDEANPFRSADEGEVVEAYKAKADKQERANGTFQTSGFVLPFADQPESPTKGNDPFVFDDVGGEIGEVSLPFADSDGPQF